MFTSSMVRFQQVLRLLVFVLLTASIGCRGTIDSQEDIFVTLNETSLQPGMIAGITADKPITQSSYLATISGVEVDVVKVGDKEMLFIVPVLNTGNHTLVFDNSVFASTLNITIASYTPITSPDNVLNTYIAETETNLTALTALVDDYQYAIPPANLAILTRLKDLLVAEWAFFPADEQTLLAYYIQNNFLGYTVDTTFSFNAQYFAKQSNIVDPGDELLRVANPIGGLTEQPYRRIDVLGSALFSSNPENELKRLALTTSLSVLTELYYAFSLRNASISITALADSFYRPRIRDTIPFFNDSVTDIGLQIVYRSLNVGDDNVGSSELATFVNNAERFQTYWGDLSELVNRLERWFDNTDTDLVGNAVNIAVEGKGKFQVVEYDPSYITIDNISVSNITVLTDTTGGIFRFKATAGAGVTLPTLFSYDIVYTHPVFNLPIRTSRTGILQ